ncbi:hypothetical protein VRK_15170 [Vibrio sp. MEBiC08052]|nr:hypothetical protein VRK_15170 [Vibrio sp. MEBiC08052]
MCENIKKAQNLGFFCAAVSFKTWQFADFISERLFQNY